MKKRGIPRDCLVKIARKFPEAPGVYLMKGAGSKNLYIGKAQNLKKRVLSYFYASHSSLSKISALLSKLQRIDFIETPTEADALLLEAILIKRYQCPYNTLLRDDKSYPLLKITAERFPRLIITRNRTEKKATYYGPYTDAKLLREVVRIVNGLFPIRKCRQLPKSACLYFHIGQCLAPCICPEVKERYDAHVREINSFLKSGKKSLVDYLAIRMHAARRVYRFEDAQFFKEQIEALSWMKKKRFNPKMPESGIGLSGTIALKKLLGMPKIPERIACFDVSNVHGDEAVASKVSFVRELENKMEYRRYRIKTVSGIDDYKMIQEALSRMLRGLREGREAVPPDLIVIDGGRGHLRAASSVLKSQDFEDVEVIAIAKQFEHVFSKKQATPIVIPRESPALRLLQRIRDEAHRFAIRYHRSLKEKKMSRSFLDDIPGIGEKRKRILLEHFSSLDEIRKYGEDFLSRLQRIGPSAAKKVMEYLS